MIALKHSKIREHCRARRASKERCHKWSLNLLSRKKNWPDSDQKKETVSLNILILLRFSQNRRFFSYEKCAIALEDWTTTGVSTLIWMHEVRKLPGQLFEMHNRLVVNVKQVQNKLCPTVGGKIWVNHRGVSQNFCRKLIRDLLVFLKVYGMRKLCIDGLSQFFVGNYLSHSTKKLRLGNLWCFRELHGCFWLYPCIGKCLWTILSIRCKFEQ